MFRQDSKDRGQSHLFPSAIPIASATGPEAHQAARYPSDLSLPSQSSRTLERIVQAAAIFVGATYLVTGLAYLWLDYSPYTETDFWQIYQVSFYYPWWKSALFKIHNHSLFFPSFFWLADLHFFAGSQLMLFLSGLCLQVICTLLLLLPSWRDATLGLTGKLLATMTIVFASFWMGRAAITTSGGFNCITSLALFAAASALLLLPRLQPAGRPSWPTISLLIGSGFVATFSFGSGAAVWPTLLFLGWCLRVPWKSLAFIGLAALLAVAIYEFLPPPEDRSELWQSLDSTPILALASLKHLCRFLGAPLFFSWKAWEGVKISKELIESSGLLLSIGGFGLCLALLLLGISFFHRNLRGQEIKFLGLALIGFNLCVAVLAVISRVERFQELPADASAPRYFYWSWLFWAGFLLILIYHANRRRWLRGPCMVLVLAFPVLGWQFHREEGLHWRYARLLATEGATALINDVTDPERLLAPKQEHVDALAPQLRSRRLDMFAEGMQDWINHPASKLFDRERFDIPMRGKARIEKIPAGPGRNEAVRVTGTLAPGEARNVSNMVILDNQGMVVGIARSFETSELVNSLLFAKRMPGRPLRGYIRQYNPTVAYSLRSVVNNRMSVEAIAITPAASTTRP